MTTNERLCGLCGRVLSGYTHYILVGEVHDSCMVAFYYGVSFQKPDGSVVVHNRETCGLCSVVYIPLKETS